VNRGVANQKLNNNTPINNLFYYISRAIRLRQVQNRSDVVGWAMKAAQLVSDL